MTLSWKEVPVQLDAVFGSVNVIQEMLLFWQEGALSVLPALPARWKSGSVKGMVFPGGRIDICWEESGMIALTIYADKDLDTDVLICGKVQGHIRLDSGKHGSWKFNK